MDINNIAKMMCRSKPEPVTDKIIKEMMPEPTRDREVDDDNDVEYLFKNSTSRVDELLYAKENWRYDITSSKVQHEERALQALYAETNDIDVFDSTRIEEPDYWTEEDDECDM